MTDKVNSKDLPVISEEIVQRNEFIEIKYTGYANGEIFDSNIDEDIKILNKELKGHKIVIAVGEEMVVKGFDKALEGKEVGKDYEIILNPEEAFGKRKRELVKTIPLNVFRGQKVDPKPGMMFTLDNIMVKVIAVSGARVVADFNNPLAGKIIKYKFKIIKKVTEENEKAKALFQVFFKGVPEFDIKDKIVVRGPKTLEVFVKVYSNKFKELMGKALAFEERKTKKEEEKINPLQ